MENGFERHQAYVNQCDNLEDETPHYLERIKVHANLNAFSEVYHEEALDHAKELDCRRNRGVSPGPLAGLVFAAEDIISFKNHKLTCAAHVLNNYRAPDCATVLHKILDADGIIPGKTNTDEFAMGAFGEHSVFGAVKNPLIHSGVAGGSSSGSAAVIAAGLCDLAPHPSGAGRCGKIKIRSGRYHGGF